MINKPLNKNFKKAFSLIELSVVVLIIGILIAGITQSSRLVRAMKLNTARSLTRSSDVNSIRNLTAWFDATAEGVFSSSCNTSSTNTDLTSVRVFNTNTSTGNPSVTTPSSAYIMPEHRQVVRLWKDSNPQGVDADKVILEYAHHTTGSIPCATKDYSVSGTIGDNRGPMYHNSGLAGLPSIYFDGAASSWFSSINPVTMPIAAGKKDFSLFVVYRTDPDYSNTYRSILQFSPIGGNLSSSGLANHITLISSNASSDSCSAIPGLSFDSSTNNCTAHSFRPQNARYTSKPSTEYVFGIAIDATDTTTSSTANTKIYLNSSSPATDLTLPSTSLSSVLNILTTGQLNVGGGYNGVFKGYISEVLIFDRKINNEEASSVMTYLVKKYNIKSL